MMVNFFVITIALIFSISTSALAKVEYYPDPVYKKLGAGDHHPMDEVLDLAKNGDERAQFIMGDLYSKGKGGISKNITKAKKWFKASALQGYSYSFIRLAAIAKRENKNIEAWHWYTLAIKNLDYGDKRNFVLKARKNLSEQAKLSEKDMSKGRKLVKAWEEKREKILLAEKISPAKKAVKTKNEDTSVTSSQVKVNEVEEATDIKVAQEAKTKTTEIKGASKNNVKN